MIQDLLSGKPILLFDGVCNLCNNYIQYLIRHDPDGRLRFGSLQSVAASQLLDHFGVQVKAGIPDTVILIHNGRYYMQSAAVLQTLRILGRPWSWLAWPISLVPAAIRDWAYAWVSRNRYRWFGKQESCLLPSPELKTRFIPAG